MVLIVGHNREVLAQIKKTIWPRVNSRRPDDETFAILLAHIDQYGEISIKGPLSGLVRNEWIDIVNSRYQPDSKHGPTIEVLKFKRVIPDRATAGPELAAAWLSQRLPGVGPKTAAQIVKEVGIARLLEEPELLRQYVPTRFQDQAIARWSQVNDTLSLDALLESVGITSKRRENLIKQLGGPHATLEALRDDPWDVGRRFPSIQFPTCEKLAELLQCNHKHPSRISAGALYSLERRGLTGKNMGDTMHPTEAMIPYIGRILKLDKADWDLIPPAIEQNPEITALGPKMLATSNLYDSEKSVFYAVKRLLDAPPLGINPKLVTEVAKAGRLDDVQTSGLHIINDNAISALTGGPGTGKTTTLGVFVRLCKMAGKTLTLVAPTGKAARRLSTVADHPASTIHRWIAQVDAGSAEQTDMVVIDESSMISSTLMARLLKTVDTEIGRCVLVGDVNQLPPVEPGAPFKDLLLQDALPVVHLTKIWRQAGTSLIPLVAQAITKGMVPSDDPRISKDSIGWRYIECDTPEQVEHEATVESLRQHVTFGFDGAVVLSPHYRWAAGVDALGKALQQRLNPKPRYYFKGSEGEYRVGDPVLHKGNKYGPGGVPDLTHAMTGHVVEIRKDGNVPMIGVEWEDGKVRFHPIPNGKSSEVLLGYAFSYHRSQGSEYPGVVVALAALPDNPNFPRPAGELNLGVVNREAIYTGITRAKQEVVLVAQKGVLRQALQIQGSRRRTALSGMLVRDRRDRLEAA